MKRLLNIWLIFPCGLALAQAPQTCHEKANTAMEKLYCDVKEKSPSTQLPTLNEFRKNPEKTQRLILKRPASKLGLTLPEESKVKTKALSARVASNTSAVPDDKATSSQRYSATGGLSDYCNLDSRIITCDNLLYQLQENIPNSRLSKDALSLDDTLSLPPFEGDKALNNDVIPYLEQTYLTYINHMLKIGLGASTMSFTKFYHTFMEVETQKVSFATRLSKMFVYLKKDKASIAVQTRFNDLLPQTLDNCSAFSKQIIVCDNVKQNWVYQATAPIL